ncbi:hypothetical protein SASPL_129087 [Salvia splendens]|uniref:Uncharacterized protein n=1 Tax=Salvia splendens TaxID=180675 RepID=A0A8X8ZND8_SALSN|nr:hypothetical protein SASPL_129087 [Salvia splendens]
MVNGIVRGTDLTATTALPLRDCALVNFWWGLRFGQLAGACLEVKRQLDVNHAENGSLNKALTDLRSDLAAGKMEIEPESNRSSMISGGGADRRGDKRSPEGKGFGEVYEGLKVA